MRLSVEGVLSGIGVVALLGPVISVIIRQVQGPVVRPFDVDGLSVQCLLIGAGFVWHAMTRWFSPPRGR